jgi:hypothetical protein
MDSRILGLIGGVLIIIGIFLPLVTVTYGGDSQSASFFDAIKAGSWEGYVVLLCGIASIALAAMRKYRFLLITGIIALGVIVLNFINFKSSIAKAAGQSLEQLETMGVTISTQWVGWLVLILGGVLLLIAGATGRNQPVAPQYYGAAPPPPPPGSYPPAP